MIGTRQATIEGDRIWLRLGGSADVGGVYIPIDVARVALSEARGTARVAWDDHLTAREVFVKVVRRSYRPEGMTHSWAEREVAAYERLSEARRSQVAACYGIFTLPAGDIDEGSEDVLYIFALEALGPRLDLVAKKQPGREGQLARLMLRDGLTAIKELEVAQISSRDLHAGNFVFVADAVGVDDDLRAHTLKIIDFGHSLTLGSRIETTQREFGLPAVQSPWVLSGRAHRGLVDETFGLAASVYQVASRAKTPYVRTIGGDHMRIGSGDHHYDDWTLRPDPADLSACDPEIRDLILEILRVCGGEQIPSDLHRRVDEWRRRASEGTADPWGAGTAPASSPSGTSAPSATSPPETKAPGRATVLAEKPQEAAGKSDADNAREWLRLHNVTQLAGPRDFRPRRSRKPLHRRLVLFGLIAALIAVAVFATVLVWPWWFGRREALPSTFGTFAGWQSALAWGTATVACLVGIAFAVWLYVLRIPWALTASAAFVVALVFYGLGMGAADKVADRVFEAAEAPLACTSSLVAAPGARISCVDEKKVPKWWTAEKPFVQTETKDDKGELVAFDVRYEVGFQTAARIVYPFTFQPGSCAGAWLYVYQSSEKVKWGADWTQDGKTVRATPVRDGADAVHLLTARNSWRVNVWSEASEKGFSEIREYVLTGPDQEWGIGTTQAKLVLRATDCPQRLRSEFEDSGPQLLEAAQLAASPLLDPAFIQVRDPKGDVPSSALAIPVEEGIRPVYARWPTESKNPWKAGTEAVLDVSGVSFPLQIWIEPLAQGATAPTGWTETWRSEKGAREYAAAYRNGDQTWLAKIYLEDASALGAAGEKTLQRLEDGIRVFGKERVS